MIGEISKKRSDYEASIKYYLRGISQEPSFIDNYLDIAELCEILNENQISTIFYIFSKIIALMNEISSLDQDAQVSSLQLPLED